MTFRIDRGGVMPPRGLVADRRLYLDATKSRVLEDGDPTVAWLLCPAGREITAAEVARLGLVLRNGRVEQGGAEEPEAPKVDAPAVVVPAEPVRRRNKKSDG